MAPKKYYTMSPARKNTDRRRGLPANTVHKIIVALRVPGCSLRQIAQDNKVSDFTVRQIKRAAEEAGENIPQRKSNKPLKKLPKKQRLSLQKARAEIVLQNEAKIMKAAKTVYSSAGKDFDARGLNHVAIAHNLRTGLYRGLVNFSHSGKGLLLHSPKLSKFVESTIAGLAQEQKQKISRK